MTVPLITVAEYPLPQDLQDCFTAVGWARPELYLIPEVRENMSPFRLLPKAILEKGLSQLRQDLTSGAWDVRYGHLRTGAELRVGYVFVQASTPGFQSPI